MEYFGVHASGAKKKSFSCRRFYYREESTKNLSFDCYRHVEFLEKYTRQKDTRKSCYFAVNKFYSKRKEEDIVKKMNRFVFLFEKIKKEGFDYLNESITVTEGAARLNGSHRASICYVLGIDKIKVKVVTPPRGVENFLSKEVRMRKKYYHLYKGLRLADAEGGIIGKILYTDCIIRRLGPFVFKELVHVTDTMKIVRGRDAVIV